jgi:hypothetical protein
LLRSAAVSCSKQAYKKTLPSERTEPEDVMMARLPRARTALISILLPGLALAAQARADSFRIEKAEWKAEDARLTVVGKGRDGRTVEITNAGPSGALVGSTRVDDDDWRFREGGLVSSEVPCRIRATQSDGESRTRDVEHRPADCDDGTGPGGGGGGGGTPDEVSINSTSQNSADAVPGTTPAELGPVPEQPFAGTGGYQVLAINDLGMHCGDFDTRISSILPPFQVPLIQVIRKGEEPELMGPGQVKVFYSAVSNPDDPILAETELPGLLGDGHVFKTNFWDVIPLGAYDPFYPPVVTPLSGAPFTVTVDEGLPVPNVEHLYIGPDGQVNSGDEFLSAVQHAMPGIGNAYVANVPQEAVEYYHDKPFFVNFPFGYVADDLNWFEGAGVPFAAFDDFGRENAYPLVRVQATDTGGQVLATVDTVLPISGEASCKNCHADPLDPNFSASRTDGPTDALTDAGLPVVASDEDPEFQAGAVPVNVAVEWATDQNVLRLHDLRHGDRYVDTDGNAAACDTGDRDGDGDLADPDCLINRTPVVCQVCHYTPALDLAHVGPKGGDAGNPDADANGRVQRAHQSNSRVMHSHHGQFTDLFPPMPAPVQNADGTIANQPERLAVLEDTCYQCHPGTNVRCLRGAMFNGGMLCNDCHGDMQQVGNDFTAGVSPDNPSAFILGGDFYDPADPQPRVPWANEPGCGSCHTGDVLDNALTNGDVNPGSVVVNTADIFGNADGIRLRRAYRSGDAKATPIVPSNKRFAEDPVPASFNGFANPGAGNPKLYRVSTGGTDLPDGAESGHGGLMCEGCHGATHAEWPNANPLSNDNVTANQLQGHTGVIIECSTCHTGDLGDTLDGPHGMHPVGDVDFVNGGHEHIAEDDLQACARCHGEQGEGTVLSVAKTDRSGLEDLDGTLTRGTAVGCGLCHENPFTEGGHD